MRRTISFGVLAPFCLALAALAAKPASDIPVARPEIKQQMEELKYRQPRLPLPELTDEERASGESITNFGHMRRIYLPASWLANYRISGDSAMTLDSVTRSATFWIISRTNNCFY